MKKILISLFVLGVTLSFATGNGNLPAENGRLSGVVTYKETYGAPGQADAGCVIYAINETVTRNTEYEYFATAMENFQLSKSDYLVSVYNTIDPDRIKNLQDNFDRESGYIHNYIAGFTKLPGIARVVANAAGKYTLSLKPGRYYLLFVSGNAKSNNAAESKGNIDHIVVDIKPAGEIFRDISFVKNDNIMIMLITHRDRPGC